MLKDIALLGITVFFLMDMVVWATAGDLLMSIGALCGGLFGLFAFTDDEF